MFTINKPGMGLQETQLLDSLKPNQTRVAKKQVPDFGSGTILSAEKTQKILQHELATKLKQRFGEEGIELKGLDADAYTPEKVSDRILSFVESALARVPAGEERDKLMEEARKGIDQGFGEARDILQDIGVLQGKVKNDIDKTYDLIQTGLDRLENPDKEPEAFLIEEATSAQYEAQRSRGTSVEIYTQDGDKVTINAFREEKFSASQAYASDGNNSLSTFSQSSSSFSSIQYQVDGDLDDDERAAIEDLLSQVKGVAADFYNGNVEDAFNKAMDIGFDSDELAKFSVNMNQIESQQVAVSTYQNVQENTQEGAFPAPNQSIIQQAADFMSQLNQLMKHNAMSFLEKPEQSVQDLLQSTLAANNGDSVNEEKATQQENLFNNLFDSLKRLNSEQSES